MQIHLLEHLLTILEVFIIVYQYDRKALNELNPK